MFLASCISAIKRRGVWLNTRCGGGNRVPWLLKAKAGGD